MFHLPIDDVLPSILNALSSHTQVILSAPPGAGKSTRLPEVLLNSGELKATSGKIILLEPRRLAASHIAHYLAAQRGEKVGKSIGLRMRGDTRISEQTRLEVVTEGVLTRLIQQDPSLDGVSLIIFDEFHERSIHSDLALALALDVQMGWRDDLYLLIMSATLDNQALAAYLPHAMCIESKGRNFPVIMRYQPISRQPTRFIDMAKAILALMREEEGSALVFLPGVGDIHRLAERLSVMSPENFLICPLYGQLSIQAQQAAIHPAPVEKRKIVLATNIAETSLTIDGIRLVVDLGFEKVAKFNRKSGFTKLDTFQIAKSSAIQRAGRAGRTTNGVCLRFYSEETFERMPSVASPEILTSDLTALVLDVVQWGCKPTGLHWLDAPPELTWKNAEDLLHQLDILDENRKLTAKGKFVIKMGTDPRLGALLYDARRWGLSLQSDAAWFAAWVESGSRNKSERNLLDQLRTACHSSSQIKQRAMHFAKRMGIKLNERLSGQDMSLLMVSAWPDRIAQARDNKGRFLLANGVGAQLATDDPLSSSPYLVVLDAMSLTKGDLQIFLASEVDITQVELHFPTLFNNTLCADWDESRGRLVAETQHCCGSIVLSRQSLENIPDDAYTSALFSMIRRRGLSVLDFPSKAASLLTRAQCAQAWALDLNFPSMKETCLLAQLDSWLLPYVNGVRTLSALQSIDLYSALEARIGWQMVKKLNHWLPETYKVPTGSIYQIQYQVTEKPRLSVRLQEMYGQTQSPTIANGTIPLVLELLSPARRPLQVTQDLSAFWKGAYVEVKKEMKGRYPKHVWPDDPAQHQPTALTKRHFKSNSEHTKKS